MHVVQVDAEALVGDALLRPQALDEGEVVLEARDALALGHAEGVELHVAIAQAHAEDEVAAADDVQRGDRLGGVDGVVQVEQQDAAPDRHLAGLGRQARQERHRLQLLVVALVQVVLPRQQRVPAAVARHAHHGVLVVERAHHVGVEELLVGDEEADFHGVLHNLRDLAGLPSPLRGGVGGGGDKTRRCLRFTPPLAPPQSRGGESRRAIFIVGTSLITC